MEKAKSEMTLPCKGSVKSSQEGRNIPYPGVLNHFERPLAVSGELSSNTQC